MAEPGDRKLYLGPRLRVLRRELGLNQTQMAGELGISPSYLNHLERNQRPVTAQMLLRLAQTYDLDMLDFVARAGEVAANDLHEVFSDPLVRDLGVPRHEVREIAENYPAAAEAVTRLYRALADLRGVRERVESLSEALPARAEPLDWLRGELEQRRNHYAEIDEAAEALSHALGDGPEALAAAMVARLAESGIAVRVVPHDLLVGTSRHYDLHRRRLMLSERLPATARSFGIAYQLAFQAFGEAIEQAVRRASPPDAEAAALARIALGNYAAAAILMPYARFQEAARASRHDLDLLAARFGVSLEQVAHRLTTLNRPGARGIPFFFLKIDRAGNVSKRFGAETLPIARFGGGCPRWGIQRAFQLPGEGVAGFAETPDGTPILSLARAVAPSSGGAPVLLVLGCEAKHAAGIGAADGLAARPTPIGPACHLCERLDCPDRALPPVTRRLDLRPYRRALTPYPFQPV